MRNFYNIDYDKYRLCVNSMNYFNMELPQRILHVFKIEFLKLETLDVNSVNKLLQQIYVNSTKRRTSNYPFVVTQQNNYIAVSFNNKEFFQIYEK